MRMRVIYGGHRSPNRYYLDDREVSQVEYEAASPKRLQEALEAGEGGGVSNLSSCWPMVSDACAVHPKQVEQARARAKRHGVNVRYNSKGQVIIPDRGERRKLLKLEGYIDQNSFTGN